jgi:hypothetical protein
MRITKLRDNFSVVPAKAGTQRLSSNVTSMRTDVNPLGFWWSSVWWSGGCDPSFSVLHLMTKAGFLNPRRTLGPTSIRADPRVGHHIPHARKALVEPDYQRAPSGVTVACWATHDVRGRVDLVHFDATVN